MDAIKIDKKSFFKKFNHQNISLEKAKLFTKKDLKEIDLIIRESQKKDLLCRIFDYFLFTFKDPRFLFNFFFKRKSCSENLVRNYELKLNIVSCFNPKVIIEIGTYFGGASAVFKKMLPKVKVITINPLDNEKSNNAISDEKIGYFFKKKKLNVSQIFKDSLLVDYTKLPKPDVIYLDGNHSFKYVFTDLMKVKDFVDKAILVDDYLPKDNNFCLYGPWNHEVTLAVNKFLEIYSGDFNAFWLEKTRVCVLIKKQYLLNL